MAYPTNPTSINIPGTVSHLNKQFASSIQKLGYLTGVRFAVRDTEVYDFQVQYAYIINSITTSPGYIVPKFVTSAHELIREVDKRIEEIKEQKAAEAA